MRTYSSPIMGLVDATGVQVGTILVHQTKRFLRPSEYTFSVTQADGSEITPRYAELSRTASVAGAMCTGGKVTTFPAFSAYLNKIACGK